VLYLRPGSMALTWVTWPNGVPNCMLTQTTLHFNYNYGLDSPKDGLEPSLGVDQSDLNYIS
jgi:hypothetical protein